jgi:conjugal transfer pilin signal peptidase TrbI
VSNSAFWTKKRLGIVLIAPILMLGGWLTTSSAVDQWARTYQIGIDPQNTSCLPWTVYLHSTKPFDDHLHYGDIVSFRARNLVPHFKNGALITKFVAGLPGDRVEIRDDRVYINGVFWDALWGMKYLESTPGQFDRHFTVNNDEVLVMAVTAGSYDGRYWGTLKKDRIIGYAKPIF